jgi:hypothetical protein
VPNVLTKRYGPFDPLMLMGWSSLCTVPQVMLMSLLLEYGQLRRAARNLRHRHYTSKIERSTNLNPDDASWRLLLLCWFLDAGNKEAPQTQLTSVQKAPRHEVGGSWAPARQRGPRRFNAGADADDGRDVRTTPVYLHIREVGRVQEAFWLLFGAHQRVIRATDGCDWAGGDPNTEFGRSAKLSTHRGAPGADGRPSERRSRPIDSSANSCCDAHYT